MNDFVWLHNMGFSLFFSIAGALLTVIGILVLRQSWLEKYRWTTASGTIVGYKETLVGKRRSYAPQVQFAPAEGKPVTFTSSMDSNIKFRSIGDSVQVLYDPRNPEKAAIKSFSNLFLPGVVLVVLGLAFLGIALRPLFAK